MQGNSLQILIISLHLFNISLATRGVKPMRNTRCHRAIEPLARKGYQIASLKGLCCNSMLLNRPANLHSIKNISYIVITY